jgi:hypothetical protein
MDDCLIYGCEARRDEPPLTGGELTHSIASDPETLPFERYRKKYRAEFTLLQPHATETVMITAFCDVVLMGNMTLSI